MFQLLLCLLVCFSERGTVSIRGGNISVAQDQQVQLQCDISAWFPEPSVGWLVNGAAVDSIRYNTTSTADGNLFNSTSILNLQAGSSSTVECRATVAALQSPVSSSVVLTVGTTKHSSGNMTETTLAFAQHCQGDLHDGREVWDRSMFPNLSVRHASMDRRVQSKYR